MIFHGENVPPVLAPLEVIANLLPSLASPVWDTSWLVSNSSVAGKALQGLMGYDARPAGMQIAFFVVALLAIGAGMAWVKRRSNS